MGDGFQGHLAGSIWLLLGLILLLGPPITLSICPSKCSCEDEALVASCVAAGLEFVPIQLNPDVKVIRLSGNRIASVDYTLTFYTKLVELDVSRNKITSLGARNFEAQSKLKHLNASNNLINTLGKDAFRGLIALENLDLSRNQIQNVEKWSFRDAESLKFIDLSYNLITSFENSEVFNEAKGLRHLLLHGNQILDVPSALLKSLPSRCSLEKLTLSDNLIDELKASDFSAPCSSKIQTLTLASNAIREVDKAAFDSLYSLASLDLSSNNLTYIPTQQLSKLDALVELDLSGNTFSSVRPVAFQSLFRMRVLRLSRLTKLRWIDSRAFVDNIRLEEVYIDGNPELDRLPTRLFHGNPHLRLLSLAGNALSTADVSHFPLDRLASLDMTRNPLVCNCSLHWLWRLAQDETRLRNSQPSNSSAGLRLNVVGLTCASPENLKGHDLVGVPESNVRCETTWLTVIIITSLVLTLFGAACVVLLLFTSERQFACSQCRRSGEKERNDTDDCEVRESLRRGSAAGPILMLMPDSNGYGRDTVYNKTGGRGVGGGGVVPHHNGDIKLVDSCWVNESDKSVCLNEYTVDRLGSKRPHIVYV